MSTTEQVNASSSLSSSGDDGVAVCYLCHGEGVDDNDGQPLRRDCACRGTDAGFFHLACLADYAQTTSNQALDMNEFVIPWLYCPSCHQEYQNELGIDIANKFASFVRRQYPDDTRRQTVSLYGKLYALNNMLDRLQPVQKREAGDTADVLLSLIDRMKNESPPLPMLYSFCEAYAYQAHGQIALNEGTEKSARRAVVHFENQLRVNEANANYEGIATAKSNIAKAKSKYEGDSIIEELLKASQELYEFRIAENGEDHEYTIRAGNDYAIALGRRQWNF
jgi:hypothetical protein